MSVPSDVESKIEATRITYPEREHGVTISGSPFVCEFHDPVSPKEFCGTITTVDDPWRMFGVRTQLSEEYWKVVGNLFHVENDELVGVSQFSIEVAPEWMRVYVKNECSAERVAEFVRALDNEYGIETKFPSED